MSCQLKNVNGPFEIQCSFPEVADGKGDFSVYFNSFDEPAAPAERIVSCAHNGKYACIPDEVFVKHEGLNTATITLTETFAKKNGAFSCQRGDLPITNKCQFRFLENVNPINSLNSEVDREITAHGVSTLKPEDMGNGGFEGEDLIEVVMEMFLRTIINRDGNTAVIIGVTIGALVLVLILVIGLLLYRRYKFKKRRKLPGQPNKDKSAQSIKVVNESKTTKMQLWFNEVEMLMGRDTHKEINIQISGNQQGSTLNEPQENGGKGHKSAECNINDSGPEEESGSSPSGSEGSNSPLISCAEWKNPPV